MCGIAGVIGENVSNWQVALHETLLRLGHRGPDGTGIIQEINAIFGQTRLAIIDLEGGDQPMWDTTNSYCITYNGELYNFRELRERLEKSGYKFKTQSDTEVVLNAYAHWKEACLDHLRGMFAFGIWDKESSELFLARDPFGIKPLVYSSTKDNFFFSSEIQALKPFSQIDWSIDLESVDLFLHYQYIPAPKTIFNGVKKLPPAHFMKVDKFGKIKCIESYWDLQFEPDYSKSEDEWNEILSHTISESVKSHLVSDVPFGAFLSGGIDSSLVVAEMAKIMGRTVKTFSIGFEQEDYSELKYARQVAKKFGSDHFEEIVKPAALKILPELVRHYGEPFGDVSSIPTYYVSRLASREVKMVLSGDGGDELFAGYENYTNYWSRNFSPIPEHLPGYKKFAYKLFNQVIPQKYPLRTSTLNDYDRYISYFQDNERNSLWKKDLLPISDSNNRFNEEYWIQSTQFGHFQKAQYVDFKTYLPFAVLTKVDIASMIHSLEVRTPFLDKKVVEVASRIPENINISKVDGSWTGKRVLKSILSKEMGSSFANRKKMGFGVPLDHWFTQDSKAKSEINERLLTKGNHLDDYFEVSELEKLASEGRGSKKWLLIFLQEWLDQNKA